MSAKDLIITLPNDRLRAKSQRVQAISDEVRQVIENMKKAALDWEASRNHEVGVALAAIQIDQPWRIIVIRNNFDNKDDRSFTVFINPQIVKLEGDWEEDYEGCLSVKDIYGRVPRRSKIRMRALNEDGKEVRVRAEGFLARVLQHEIDHTQGIMFVDHIQNAKEAFYKITKSGELEKLDYEKVEKAGIFRD